MKNEVLEVLGRIKKIAEILSGGLVNGQTREAAAQMDDMASAIEAVKTVIPVAVYEQYRDFFEVFTGSCRRCGNIEFLKANKGELLSSFELFKECMEDLKSNYISRVKICPCCGNEVIYDPLSEYYSAMARKYQTEQAVEESRLETLNKQEYSCPQCGGSDRDRLIISFLKKEGLDEAREGMKVLQIAPAVAITLWIQRHCPHIAYETTDLYMDNVSFQSDIMNMDMIRDDTYDVIICSHVLEHVKDDRKALSELRRILKPDGKVVFLVPIELSAADIDEEWGLSEAENWRRFGQGDHCRLYSKEGVIHRLEEQFYVHSLGKEYFGEEVFRQCALTDTSTLYVLTKSKEIPLCMAEELEIDEALCYDGPLVSVVLPCYNHEEYVAEAIESIRDQTYKNIEILAGDDGSADGTASVMKRYSSYLKKEIYFENNVGMKLWKLLWQSAKGKYIAVAHSDDVWVKDKIAAQVTYMEAHPECGICFTWCKYKDIEGKELDDFIFIQPNRSSHEWMRFFWENGNALCHPSMMIRREVHEARMWHAGRQLPDFFSWIEAVQMTSIHVIPKVLVHMRRTQQCMSFPTKEVEIRSTIEDGCGWLWGIRNMDDEFFKKAFAPYMRNPEADTKEEIQCEKYFLMLEHAKNPFISYDAMCYYFDIYHDAGQVMEEEYHYTTNDFARDVIEKNIFFN